MSCTFSMINAACITVVDNTQVEGQRIYELPAADGEDNIEVDCDNAKIVVTFAAYKRGDDD